MSEPQQETQFLWASVALSPKVGLKDAHLSGMQRRLRKAVNKDNSY